MAGHPTRIELRPTDLVAIHYLQKLVLSPSQNISICWLLPIMFDHSSYSKNLRKYYLFCYDKFYYHIYLKYILIVFIFSQKFLIRRMIKHDQQKSTNTYILIILIIWDGGSNYQAQNVSTSFLPDEKAIPWSPSLWSGPFTVWPPLLLLPIIRCITTAYSTVISKRWWTNTRSPQLGFLLVLAVLRQMSPPANVKILYFHSPINF